MGNFTKLLGTFVISRLCAPPRNAPTLYPPIHPGWDAWDGRYPCARAEQGLDMYLLGPSLPSFEHTPASRCIHPLGLHDERALGATEFWFWFWYWWNCYEQFPVTRRAPWAPWPQIGFGFVYYCSSSSTLPPFAIHNGKTWALGQALSFLLPGALELVGIPSITLYFCEGDLVKSHVLALSFAWKVDEGSFIPSIYVPKGPELAKIGANWSVRSLCQSDCPVLTKGRYPHL